MQLSNNGIDYRIVNGGTKIIDNLPAKVYEVNFSQFAGMWLSERKELSVGNFHIYGKTPYRIEKIFKTFDNRDKNLGILLSGEKGMGKSVFMRSISVEAIKRGLPVIVVDSPLPGIADFISKIDQECVVLFDEFEKKFLCDGDRDGDEQGAQTQFLSLFDGTDNGKKLFAVAINNTHKLSEFFINRPGRFYYHFKFTHMSDDEVREFAKDNLKPEHHDAIEKLVLLSRFHDVTYDILTAIVNELNNGYSLKESVTDLNIEIGTERRYYDATAVVEGVTLSNSIFIDFENDDEMFYLKTDARGKSIKVSCDLTKATYNKEDDSFTIDGDAVNWACMNGNLGKYKNGDTVTIDKITFTSHKYENRDMLSYIF